MSVLGVIEILLMGNMLLFVLVFSMLAQPDSLVDAVLSRIRGKDGALDQQERAERLVRQALGYLGMAGCVLLVGWSMMTGFVVTLYKEGFFWKF